MQIIISDQLSDPAESVVRFSSKIGHGAGIWKGQNAPSPGAVYDMEFEVIPVIGIGTNCSIATGETACIKRDGNKVRMVGTIEGIDADKVGYLRLATECLVLVEFADCNLGGGSQIELRLDVSEILIFPLGA